jgi:hypothetical protein
MSSPDPPQPQREQRRQPRAKRAERIFVQVVDCTEAPDLVGRILRASTEDVSAGGLRLHLENPVPVGCALELWVKVDGSDGTFLLAGEVRWVVPVQEEGGYAAGVALASGLPDDSARWRSFVAALVLEDTPA